MSLVPSTEQLPPELQVAAYDQTGGRAKIEAST